MSATGTVKGQSWDERPYAESEGTPKLVRVSATNRYAGDVEGDAVLEYLMMYRDDGTATYLGFERIVGRVLGREGSFVVQHTGSWADMTATTTLTVVAGSGTGALTGIGGTGHFAAQHEAPQVDYTFDLVLA
jgi:hypothetical protein